MQRQHNKSNTSFIHRNMKMSARLNVPVLHLISKSALHPTNQKLMTYFPCRKNTLHGAYLSAGRSHDTAKYSEQKNSDILKYEFLNKRVNFSKVSAFQKQEITDQMWAVEPVQWHQSTNYHAMHRKLRNK